MLPLCLLVSRLRAAGKSQLALVYDIHSAESYVLVCAFSSPPLAAPYCVLSCDAICTVGYEFHPLLFPVACAAVAARSGPCFRSLPELRTRRSLSERLSFRQRGSDTSCIKQSAWLLRRETLRRTLCRSCQTASGGLCSDRLPPRFQLFPCVSLFQPFLTVAFPGPFVFRHCSAVLSRKKGQWMLTQVDISRRE